MELSIESGSVPTHVFLTKGMGKHKEKLSSFEMALRDAGIEKFNLVRVSSIYPPGCKLIPRARGARALSPGQVVFCVMADNSTNEPNRLVASSIGLAIPADEHHYGYLSEHHSYGQTDEVAGDYAEDLAAQMLASTYGMEFDMDSSYDAKKEIFRIDGRIVRTMNITQSAVGDKKGYWTTTVAAAVFLPLCD
jgi:arginine decarboxylase